MKKTYEELETENARLREEEFAARAAYTEAEAENARQAQEWATTVARVSRERDDLNVENASLREEIARLRSRAEKAEAELAKGDARAEAAFAALGLTPAKQAEWIARAEKAEAERDKAKKQCVIHAEKRARANDNKTAVETALAAAQKRIETLESQIATVREALPDDLRTTGWAVAVHNDYRQNGVQHTFWLLVKDGRAVKGEGFYDADALAQIRAALASPPAREAKRPLCICDDEDDGLEVDPDCPRCCPKP